MSTEENNKNIMGIKLELMKLHTEFKDHVETCLERHAQTKQELLKMKNDSETDIKDIKKTQWWIFTMIVATLLAIIADLALK